MGADLQEQHAAQGCRVCEGRGRVWDRASRTWFDCRCKRVRAKIELALTRTWDAAGRAHWSDVRADDR